MIMNFYDKTWSVLCTQLRSNCCRVNFSVFTDYKTRKVKRWHPSGVTRTTFQVTRVNFSAILIKGEEIKLELAGNSSYLSKND